MLLHGYSLIRPVGAGGFAEVWEATAPDGARVAVKRLHGHLADDATAVERFYREASALARVDHPRVVRLVELRESPDMIVLEWVDGETLADVLDRGPLPVCDAHDVVHGILDALDAVHAVGLVHRDLKPGNVLLAKDGPKLADFGIASELVRSAPDLTPVGTTMATPAYASPELLTGAMHGVADDLWAASVLYYECLAGAPPFRGRSLEELFEAILAASPPPIRVMRDDVPEELDALFRRLLARDPVARPNGAHETRAAIDACR